MKKILLGAALLITGLFAQAQNGLENVVVEKYYVSTTADSVGSATNGGGNLPAGSVTYRLWADMLPGYNFQACYGVSGHTLLVSSTGIFYNDENFGGTTPSISATNVRKNAALLDSYFSVGGAAGGKVGVFKSEDTDGSPGNNTAGGAILQNNDPTASGPINIGSTTSLSAQDGMIAGSPVAVTYVGINNTGNGDLGVFDAAQTGGLFSTANGSVAALGGAVGPTAANRVLIGQFTTKGTFHFELNIQIGTPSGGTQQYVASNPVGAEIQAAFLTGTYPDPAPVVNITSPANGASFITGASVAIAATATDNGSVDSVAFYVDGIFLSKVIGAGPYTATYTAVVGSHCITARATDNLGQKTTTACTNITVSANPPPTVAITAPANGSTYITGATVNITATATDNTSVDSVSFYVDGVFISKVIGAGPYAATYSAAVGTHCITAHAVDNAGAGATTPCTNIIVANNPPPVVSITSPATGSSFITGSTVSISATASDNTGVDSVAFYVDGVFLSKVIGAGPYNASYLTGALGTHCLTARATDNQGASTLTACRNFDVVSSILPYKVLTSNATCVPTTFCLPIQAVASVSNIIGYDMTIQYNAAKVTPTGVITVYPDLITPSYVDAIYNIPTAGTMNISLFFNGSAPASANFSGTGNLICVEFSKTAGFTPVDTASFTVPFMQESYFTGVQSKFVSDGNFSTYRDTTFNGKLKFWAGQVPLAYDQLNPNAFLITNIYGNNSTCTSQSAVAVQPDLSGNFSYNTQNGLNVTISRDILAATDVQPVINGFDALQVKKVLLNDISFLPNGYQMVAMDVNIDGVISAGDLSQINQRTVLFIPEFKQAWNYNPAGVSNGQPSKDWLFIDSTGTYSTAPYQISTTYPAWDGVGFNKAHSPVVPFCLPIPVTNYAICPVINPETYKGVLLGDVSGNFATVGSGGIFRNASSDNKVIFDLSKAIVANGYVEVPVLVNSTDNINALDFAMKFDPSKLKYNSMVDHTSYLESLAHFNTGDNTLRFTSFSLTNYDMNKNVVSVRFAANASTITESDFSSVVGYLNGEQVAVEVRSANVNSGYDGNMVNIYPNPAKDVINVETSANAMVELMDASGREVLIQTPVYQNEKKEINTQNLANGIYMIKIYNDSFVTMKKLVINK